MKPGRIRTHNHHEAGCSDVVGLSFQSIYCCLHGSIVAVSNHLEFDCLPILGTSTAICRSMKASLAEPSMIVSAWPAT